MTVENKEKKILPAYFGEFGGMFVGELLVPALEQLEKLRQIGRAHV